MNTVHVVVEDRKAGIQRTLFWGIFAAILVAYFWQWALAITVVSVLGCAIYVTAHNRRAAQAALAARADEQTRWIATGDPRGVYGHDWEAPDERPEP